MSCFYPMQALRSTSATTVKTGKPVVNFLPRSEFGKHDNNPNLIKGLPCGQCVGCRLERSRQWAIRMVDEADCHKRNCFITLTFDEPNRLKRDNPDSLDKAEFQRFLKRLRKKYGSFRYYMCGEYGDLLGRPHYHAILFGLDFDDKILEKVIDGRYYYSSVGLRECWSFGNNIITDVNFDTCAYVARYIMKKVNGKDALNHYGQRLPEYTTMSRRSGIGRAWLDTYLQDVYPRDRKFLRGRGFSKPPKYYDSMYEIFNPEDHQRIKDDRILQAQLRSEDNTPQRLDAKRYITLSKINKLKRNVE